MCSLKVRESQRQIKHLAPPSLELSDLLPLTRTIVTKSIFYTMFVLRRRFKLEAAANLSGHKTSSNACSMSLCSTQWLERNKTYAAGIISECGASGNTFYSASCWKQKSIWHQESPEKDQIAKKPSVIQDGVFYPILGWSALSHVEIWFGKVLFLISALEHLCGQVLSVFVPDMVSLQRVWQDAFLLCCMSQNEVKSLWCAWNWGNLVAKSIRNGKALSQDRCKRARLIEAFAFWYLHRKLFGLTAALSHITGISQRFNLSAQKEKRDSPASEDWQSRRRMCTFLIRMQLNDILTDLRRQWRLEQGEIM